MAATSAKAKANRSAKDASRKREESAEAKDVLIRECADRERRELLESDIFEWLGWYGHDEFTRAFTEQQAEMIQAILDALRFGRDKAIAAPRGEGKTSIAEWVLIYCVLSGLVKFAVLFAATGADAETSLNSIRERLEENERLGDDYPEVCDPIIALENTAQRARTQTVSGKRHDNGEVFQRVASKFSWCGREIRFPNVPGSPAARAIIATRGLDAAVRGMKRGKDRPQIAVIDDPDTEETVGSEEQRDKLLKKIDRNIAGLAGQNRRLARVVLTTIQKRDSASFRLTDPTIYHSFGGQRFGFLVRPPANKGLWEEYIALQQRDWQDGTRFAHDLYASHREAMDEGAVVGNPHRRGDAGELSALQFYFNEVARIGQDAVDTEYQNDPPPDTTVQTSGLTAGLIQRQLNGLPRGVIPDGAILLTHNCDVGKTKGFHWVVRAWMPEGTGHVIDYGIMSVQGTKYGSDEGLERALYAAVLRRMEDFRGESYATAAGEILEKTISTFDCRWQTDAILSAVAKCGKDVFGIMGIGRSAGCVKGTFRDVVQNSATRRKLPTTGAYEELHTGPYGKLWAIHADADKWKGFEHQRWLTAQDRPGCLFLFGEKSKEAGRLSADERTHEEYARHICAEAEVQDGQQRKWIETGRENDFLDASWHSCCAAAVKGIRVLGVSPPPKPKAGPTTRLTLKRPDGGSFFITNR